MSNSVSIIYHEELSGYDFGVGHPFRGNRFEDFPSSLEKYGESLNYELKEASPADLTDLLKITGEGYVDFTEGYFNSAGPGEDRERFFKFHSGDNVPGDGSGDVERAARIAVGQAKMAADLIVSGTELAISIGGGFHHAGFSHGEGFCIYNDVAFAGKYLLEKDGIDRVMILDTDAHFGNGTYEYFSEDPEVLVVDLHQDPATIYPGTGFADQVGEGRGEGYTINIPLPPGSGDESYRTVFEEVVSPLTEQFDPQVIIRNGGGDPYSGDPLTDLGVTLAGLRMIGDWVRKLRESTGAGLVDLIVSGYSGSNLHRSWVALIAGLTGSGTRPLETTDKIDHGYAKTKEVIGEVKELQDRYWNL
ncbi:MAG: histone deacetylase family protein [Candidatus Bipolaricaulota bacterium]